MYQLVFLCFTSLFPSLFLPRDCNPQESNSKQPSIQALFSREHRLAFSTSRGPKKRTFRVWFCGQSFHQCEGNRDLIDGGKWWDNNLGLQLESPWLNLSMWREDYVGNHIQDEAGYKLQSFKGLWMHSFSRSLMSDSRPWEGKNRTLRTRIGTLGWTNLKLFLS